MALYVLALLIGVVAGLRAMTAPAAVSWAAALGLINLEGTWLAFLGYRFAPWIMTVLAIGELINDKLPKTPSRKEPVPFLARVVSGGIAGAALTAPALTGGLAAGAAGGIAGTLGGYEFRGRLVKATGGRDLPIALLEDLIAIGAAALAVTQFA